MAARIQEKHFLWINFWSKSLVLSINIIILADMKGTSGHLLKGIWFNKKWLTWSMSNKTRQSQTSQNRHKKDR